jgi:hypothetical protein
MHALTCGEGVHRNAASPRWAAQQPQNLIPFHQAHGKDMVYDCYAAGRG